MVLTSFYESTPSAQDPMENTISPGAPENSGNARANIPDASEECDNRGASGFSRIVFKRFPGKASGVWHSVIDLKQLNAYIYAPHTISFVLSTVPKGDYTFKTDLQDAYFHVLIVIHSVDRKYLCFAFENKVYQF